MEIINKIGSVEEIKAFNKRMFWYFWACTNSKKLEEISHIEEVKGAWKVNNTYIKFKDFDGHIGPCLDSIKMVVLEDKVILMEINGDVNELMKEIA